MLDDKCVIKQETLCDGEGTEKCPKGSIVTVVVLTQTLCYVVHYIGRYVSNGIEFDNTYDRNKPEEFLVGADHVIPGVDLAVRSMKKNEKSKFLIKASSTNKYTHNINHQALRKYPPQSQIPHEDLEYEIQVLGWRPDDPLENEWILSINEKIKIAKSLKEDGNLYFKENRSAKAFRIYRRALKTLKRMKKGAASEEGSTEEKNELNSLKVTCLMNMAACCLKLNGRQDDCVTYCTEILTELGDHLTSDQKLKTLFRRGQAYLSLTEFANARKDLEEALQISPDNKSVINELKKLQSEEAQYTGKLKKMYSKMFE